jgi:hypothetical protein
MQLKAFRATARRVKSARFHPVLSVVALADKDGLLQVWDFETKRVLLEVYFGDEQTGVDLQALAGAAEGGRTLSSSSAFSSQPAGGVKDLAFIDDEVLHWEASRPSCMRGSQCPGASPESNLKGSRILAVLCEHRVVLLDLLRGSRIDLPRTALDGKQPCSHAVAR